MSDRRTVDELTLEELEELLRLRRRTERLQRLRGREGTGDSIDPLTPEQTRRQPEDSVPVEHRRFEGTGATSRYRARQVPDSDHEPSLKESAGCEFEIKWGWIRDNGLLVVELGILVALVFVLIGSLVALRRVNRASSQAQMLPTLTPTPPIQVVLPGGHTPPDSPGGPAPAEIPAHLQELVDAVTPKPAPTTGPAQATRIQIPAINVDAPVLEGDDWETLKRGAGHHVGSANPGERGNCFISAHNDIFGEIFRDLPKLNLGDEIIVHTASRAYRYVVTQKRIIEPTEVEVMASTSSPVLTLLSCYPYGIDTHRIIVVGELDY